jgi:hypothetical protein
MASSGVFHPRAPRFLTVHAAMELEVPSEARDGASADGLMVSVGRIARC